jgi:hypothetical protein
LGQLIAAEGGRSIPLIFGDPDFYQSLVGAVPEGLEWNDPERLARTHRCEFDPPALGVDDHVLNRSDFFSCVGGHSLVEQLRRVSDQFFLRIALAEIGQVTLELPGTGRIRVSAMLGSLLGGESEFVESAPVIGNGGWLARGNFRCGGEGDGRSQRDNEAEAPVNG